MAFEILPICCMWRKYQGVITRTDYLGYTLKNNCKKKETLIIERANDKEFLPLARQLSKLSPKECRCALITFDWHLTIGLQRAALISSDDVHCRNVMILLKDG